MTATKNHLAEQALAGWRPVNRSTDAWRRVRHQPLALAGAAIVLVFVVVAAFAPLLAPENPTLIRLSQRLLPPTLAHPFGLDELGRDVLSRVIYGARIDFVSVLLVIAVAGTLGTAVGMAAAWFGHWWDETLMRITDIFLAFPALILAMAISAVLTPNLTNALLAISVTWWPIYARISRGQTLTIQRQDFVEGARAVGASNRRIFAQYLLPNSITPILVQATLDMGGVLLTAAGLSFIGFGAQPPTPEWGRMVSGGSTFLATQWWVATFPALAILLMVLGFNLLGDALRDLLDPRLR
ncbi:MAG TPA: ABC transporter permease [Thermomicrobiaceae bacterium]|nr:ABC transporter permease [Thermomicrobiaceae bacterium]